MKKHWLDIVLILIFLIGLSVLLYPSISEYVNSRYQTKIVQVYDDSMKEANEEKIRELWKNALIYNNKLTADPLSFYQPERVSGYESVLNITGDGMMGYIYIEKLKSTLGIFHGVEENVLQHAVGHMEGTSLPIGGEGTHCVLSGHRGLPSAKLFSDLDKLEVGDKFILNILDKVFTYEVDQISITEPSEVDNLLRVEGKDYCTLLTCTPYGVNTHRLLVRGHRVENEVTQEEVHVYVQSDAEKINPLIVAPLLAVPILIIMFIYIILTGGKKGKKNEKNK